LASTKPRYSRVAPFGTVKRCRVVPSIRKPSPTKKVWRNAGASVAKSVIPGSPSLAGSKFRRPGAGFTGSSPVTKTPAKYPLVGAAMPAMPTALPVSLDPSQESSPSGGIIATSRRQFVRPLTLVNVTTPLFPERSTTSGRVPPPPPPGAGAVACPAPKMFAVAGTVSCVAA